MHDVKGQVQAYGFGGYWEDMRNIEAFYQANMQSTKDAADVGYKSVVVITSIYILHIQTYS